jgi:peptidoglycan/xylan/chitin deacetylase (PgdA/CDA1 family)
MADEGFTIGSHGVSHKSLLQLNKEDCIVELTKSMQTIEQNINQKIDIISLPFGMYNNKLMSKLKAVGYNTALTTRVKINTSSRTFLLHRINIKGNTSIKEFEQIISSKSGLPNKKKIISNISFLVNKLLGVSRVNSLKENI